MSSLKLWYVKCVTLCTLLSTQLYLQMLSAVSHCAGSRPLTSATLINTESSRGYFSDILLFTMSQGFCSLASAGPALAPAVDRWVDVGVGPLRALTLAPHLVIFVRMSDPLSQRVSQELLSLLLSSSLSSSD